MHARVETECELVETNVLGLFLVDVSISYMRT